MFDSSPLELRSTLPQLKQALDAGEIIKIEKGHWISQGFFSRLVSWYRGEGHFNLFLLINTINGLFNEVETGKSILDVVECRYVGKALHKRCRNASSVEHKSSLSDLKARVISLYYRTHACGVSSEVAYQRVLEAAVKWQRNDPLYRDKQLTENDKLRLKQISKYSEFVAFIVSNESERKRFFQWTIRHKNNADAFVIFRNTAEKFINSSLSTRIGFYGGDDLKIQQEGKEKVLTLTIDGIHQNILDGSQHYTLKNDYTLSVDQMLQVFKDRQSIIGNLEYFPGVGVVNFNPNCLGAYIPATNSYEFIDLSKEDWFKQLPPNETITHAQASERFEDENGNKLICDGTQWVATIYATTDNLEPDATGNHAYLQIAVPTVDGHYNIYNFGKFAEYYPVTSEEKRKVAMEPVDAIIMYPDENMFNLDRLEEGISWLLTPGEGLSRMTSVKKDIQRARDKNIAFQLFNGNCIFWCFHKMHRYVTERDMRRLAGVKFIDGKPSGFLGYIWRIFKIMPSGILEPSMNWLAAKFGANNVYVITKKNGSQVEIGLLKKVPWNPAEEFPHPGAFVARKKSRRELKSLS